MPPTCPTSPEIRTITPIRRVFIANRGEIAVRIIHACHDTARVAIAGYATPDADALFVHLADEAYALGGTETADTYLNIDALIRTALAANADAVHPGYGFLSENPDFAQAVIDAGLLWIGPSPQTIRALGSKVAARRLATQVGAPMAPGTTEPVHDATQIVDFAQTHGLPVAIKAVYGGGGRGLKVVHDIDAIPEAFTSATNEAVVAFGNGDCFIERFLARPRHVEVQVLGDLYGSVVAIGTRDCSLQRRNQKLIEEAPAPHLDRAITQRLEDAAVAICQAAHYTSAGTVEFLIDPDGTISFMEVNTRIQVEHPVTEAVTGVDLVAAQLDLAQGMPIHHIPGLKHGSTPPSRGHAMEFRINAEDPALGFVPFPGMIDQLHTPTGPGIRFDTGVRAGDAISSRYDSMIAKLIVTAPTRELCIIRARRALEELAITGVPTVIPFDRAVLTNPDFCAANGDYTVYTRWIEEELLPHTDPETLQSNQSGMRTQESAPVTSWIELDGKRMTLGLPASFASLIALGSGLTDTAHPVIVADRQSSPHTANADTSGIPVSSPMPGTLVRWLADDTTLVHEGNPIAVLEAMKMETEIIAPATGILTYRAHIGDSIGYDDVLAIINPA